MKCENLVVPETVGADVGLPPLVMGWAWVHEVNAVFLVIEPTSTHDLDFWGTVYSVQLGQGGPIR